MKKQTKQEDRLSFMLSLFSTLRFLLICILASMIVFTLLIRKEEVKGTSMFPLLKDGQMVLINVAASYMTKVDRFDVVVVRNAKTDSLWVKRVIGLPDETIEYKNDILYIDHKPIKEPFLDKGYVKRIKQERDLLNFTADYKARKLGKDEYFLVGDNRIDSLDSRYEEIGPFHREQIIANGIFIITPLSEMRYIGNGG